MMHGTTNIKLCYTDSLTSYVTQKSFICWARSERSDNLRSKLPNAFQTSVEVPASIVVWGSLKRLLVSVVLLSLSRQVWLHLFKVLHERFFSNPFQFSVHQSSNISAVEINWIFYKSTKCGEHTRLCKWITAPLWHRISIKSMCYSYTWRKQWNISA
jgi:hypothetical protein